MNMTNLSYEKIPKASTLNCLIFINMHIELAHALSNSNIHQRLNIKRLFNVTEDFVPTCCT